MSDGITTPKRRRRLLRSVAVFLLLSVVAVFGIRSYAMNIGVPNTVGAPIKDLPLQPCATKANCATGALADDCSLQNMTEDQRLEVLRNVIERTGGTVLEAQNIYVRGVYRSRIFSFPDDVELLLRRNGAISIRSASRLGKGDLGVNKKRVARIVNYWKYSGTRCVTVGKATQRLVR
jgi:uncharacterized protein (DUF1499 family)